MKITIIGAGYVGLVTGAGMASMGHQVICVDFNEARLEPIRSGRAPFFEPGLDELLAKVVGEGKLSATSNLSEALPGSDVALIAVGTPSNPDGIDLSYIRAAARDIGALLPSHGGYVVVTVKSTVVPTTTETVVREEVERASGLKAGPDFGLVMNPEFLREGCAVEDFMTPDRIVLGALDDRSFDVLNRVYAGSDCPILRTTLANAEMIKYASNTLLAMMISFSNEIASLCEAVPGLSEEEVMAGMHLDRRLTVRRNGELVRPGLLSYLRAGIGFGGSCFPKDVAALQSFGREKGVATRLLDATLDTNHLRAKAVIDLLERASGPVGGRTVAVLGLAFKENTDDVRESPGLRLIKELRDRGARVRVHDVIVDATTLPIANHVEKAATEADAVRGADACVIATKWPQYSRLDWPALLATMARPVVLDGRQVVPWTTLPPSAVYVPIGAAPPAMA